jgi:16S rRNA (cytosine1402-N4)-methyltransferase
MLPAVTDDSPSSPNDPAPAQAPHRRPQRYSGKNPHRFEDKHKEHDPARHADTVAKVLAAGKTPAGTHRPIMVAEILEALAARPGEMVVDCTLGYGGHACELITRIQPGGRLIGLDADPIELTRTESRLREAGHGPEVFTTVRSNFAGLPRALADAGLGLSSMQIDDPSRGFSTKGDGPLDMRMNPQRGQPASALLQKLTAADMAELLVENADEPRANKPPLYWPGEVSRGPANSRRPSAAARRGWGATKQTGPPAGYSRPCESR